MHQVHKVWQVRVVLMASLVCKAFREFKDRRDHKDSLELRECKDPKVHLVLWAPQVLAVLLESPMHASSREHWPSVALESFPALWCVVQVKWDRVAVTGSPTVRPATSPSLRATQCSPMVSGDGQRQDVELAQVQPTLALCTQFA